MFEQAGVAITTVLSILIIVDIVGNSLVCAIIKRNRDMRYVKSKIINISRNSAVFYWKSANLIGSPTVFYSPIENSRARE